MSSREDVLGRPPIMKPSPVDSSPIEPLEPFEQFEARMNSMRSSRYLSKWAIAQAKSGTIEGARISQRKVGRFDK